MALVQHTTEATAKYYVSKPQSHASIEIYARTSEQAERWCGMLGGKRTPVEHFLFIGEHESCHNKIVKCVLNHFID